MAEFGGSISVLIATQISQYGILWSDMIAVVASLPIASTREAATTLELANAIIYSGRVRP